MKTRLALVLLQFLYPPASSLRTKLRSIAALAAISCAISALDIATGRDVTVRPLLSVVIILTGFLENRFFGFLFAAFSALLFAVSFAISQQSYASLPFTVNFLSAFLSYALLAESSMLAVRAVSKLSKMLWEAHEEISRLTEPNEHPGGKT